MKKPKKKGRGRMKSHEDIAKTFIDFSENECQGSSPLYVALARGVSSDMELLELCQYARSGQPIPNLFFGSVHYLLLKGKNHPLKEYYPSIVNQPKNPKKAYPKFKEFCLCYKDEITYLLKVRLVQTNEVRRCGYLYPVFSAIYENINKPLALIEIGTSAGFQLLWDHYAYSYGNNKWYGNNDSKLRIVVGVNGDKFPEMTNQSPKVGLRIGFDLNIVNLHDEEEKLWLRSLIWPEHEDRVVIFKQATEYVLQNKLTLIEGDGLELLDHYVEDIPSTQTICIYHTHVANQMSIEDKKYLLRKVELIGETRDVYHIYNNIQDDKLHLDYYENGKGHFATIAETESHGRYFTWLMN
ncbi:DUF2332 domain-containing protein [Terribacillus saccharophilus]|uniref:DUF2332 domain-containing protein n=1 Tax=Terribacillus saccharophilus TaxID=361277 RepID=UPI0020D191D4|nr:DUF2332 domain-containing protein [Terribacillus saccharophilus]